MRKLLILFIFFGGSISVYGQNTPVQVDEFSKASCHVDLEYNKKWLGSATGFFFELNNKVYFITNNHVVGDKYYKIQFYTNHKHYPPRDSIPNNLKVRCYYKSVGGSFFINLPLSDHGIKTYKTFIGAKDDTLDVAAIEITDVMKASLADTKILSSSNISPDLGLFASTELFIVGYPLGFGSADLYPIWKRGTIASEPGLGSDYNYTFLIDATTRSGMSGSPVYYRGNITMSKNGGVGFYNNNVTWLVGIYNAQYPDIEIGNVYFLTKIISDLTKIN